jgi:FixJ family two-component response regulator
VTGGRLIYLVDDDEAVRDSLSELLKARGHPVKAFATAGSFLAAFDPRMAGCVVLDVRLPDMDGLEVQQRLREAGLDVPVIIITGYGDVPLAVSAMKAGAADFLEKPYRPQDILERVGRAVETRRSEREQDVAGEELRSRIASLTSREREVLEKLVLGHRNKVIAREFGISPRTVEAHRARVMAKMKADSLSHLVRMALTVGLDPKRSHRE